MFGLKRIPQKNNRYFTDILVSMTITITLTIIIITFLLYVIFEGISLTIVQSFVKDGLLQISYSANLMSDMAKNLSLQVYFDSKISRLSYFSPPDIMETNNAINQLRTFKNTSPFVYSIYIYNTDKKILYTSMYSYEQITPDKQASFYDHEIFTVINDLKSYPHFIPIPRSIANAYPKYIDGSTTNVYTYIFSDMPVGTGQQDNQIILLNIKEDWLLRINSMNTIPQGDIYIINSEGKMITSNKDTAMLSNISSRDYIKEILTSSYKSGYLVDDVNGTKSLITFVNSGFLDWKFIRITPYEQIIHKIKSMRSKSMLTSTIILFIGLFISFILSRKLYKPIRNDISSLSVLQTEKNNTLKHLFLKSILQNNNVYNSSTLQKSFEKLHISLNLDMFFYIILLRIDNYEEFYRNKSIDDIELIKFAIINITSELLYIEYVNESVIFDNDQLVLICNCSVIESENFRENIKELIKKAQMNIKTNYGVSFSATISPLFDSVDKLHEQYSQAFDSSNYKLVYGHSCIIFSNDEKRLKTQKYIYPFDKEKLLLDTLMLGKSSDAENLYLQIIQNAIDYSYITMKSAVTRLAIAINMVTDSLQTDESFQLKYDLNEFVVKFEAFETLEEINGYFFSLFNAIGQKMKSRTLIMHEELINHVIDIIDKQYTDQNLSINTIAEQVNISAMYMGRLFKKYKSLSIAEYLNCIRVNKAKELLINTDSSINDILERTGFSNIKYFYTLFKKLTGKTPNQYRLLKSD